MPIIKHAVGVVQGYGNGQLATDIQKVTDLYTNKDDDITKTIVGAACKAVQPEVQKKLKELFAQMKTLVPDNVVLEVTRTKNGKEVKEPVKEVSFKMGPLKKVQRIMQKAVHYAVCEDDKDTIQLQKVRDILRATIVFPPAAWRGEGIGSAFIDAANEKFPGKVMQVKNRFIETRYPNLAPLEYAELPNDLIRNIDSLFKQTLFGRDTFYRDMQLLIRIDNDVFPNGQGMTHTILELQLASSAMYGAKVFKTKDNGSGHDMYKTIRSVMEYCEFLYWQKDRKAKPKLPGAAGYYNVKVEQWDKFAQSVETMYGLYRSRQAEDVAKNLGYAIDNSKWYKNLQSA